VATDVVEEYKGENERKMGRETTDDKTIRATDSILKYGEGM
jgi:hypothetical protein